MILSATRIRSDSGEGAIVAHVWHGAENQHVTVLRGTKADVTDMFVDARNHGATYAVRHYSISPSAATTREQALNAVGLIATEFGFDPEAAVVIEHRKRRHGGAASAVHWHVLIPEVDIGRNRVLDSHHIRQRNEKLARMLEAEAGEAFVKGRHNRAVVAQLEHEGRVDLAGAIRDAGLCDGVPATAAYTSAQHQTTKRKGLDLPALKGAVVNAWATSDSVSAFEAALAGHHLAVAVGDKKGVWVISTIAGEFVGALHRLIGKKPAEVASRMAVVSMPTTTELEPWPVSASGAGDQNAPDNEKQEEPHVSTQPDPTPSSSDRANGTAATRSANFADFTAPPVKDTGARHFGPNEQGQERHETDHRYPEREGGRRAVTDRTNHPTAGASGRRTAAGVDDALRHRRHSRRIERQLAPCLNVIAELTHRQVQPIIPDDPDVYLAALKQRIGDLRRKVAQPPPIFIDMLRTDLARTAALTRRKAADERLEVVGYDAPPKWTLIPFVIWRYRRNAAEHEVAFAHRAFDEADEAISAKAIAIIQEHTAIANWAAAEAERLMAVAQELEAGGPRVLAAVRCRCDFKTIEIAAAQENADRQALEASAKEAMEIKTHVWRPIASIMEPLSDSDDPVPTFKPPWG